MTPFVYVLAAALGSSGLFSLITHIIDRLSGRRRKLESIELGIVRLQLLNLIQHAPHMHAEILEVAHRYFAELGGNWYMQAIFTEWAGEQELPLPKWFKE